MLQRSVKQGRGGDCWRQKLLLESGVVREDLSEKDICVKTERL